MTTTRQMNTVAVIGLGRFGYAVATGLMRIDRDVVAIELDGALVQEYEPDLTLVVQGNGTSTEVLRDMGVQHVRDAVVAIGDSIEASILCVTALSDLGVPNIWAKARNETHARILRRVGAHQVVRPEQESGNRVAHSIGGQARDYVEFANGTAIAMIEAPQWLTGRPISATGLSRKYRVVIVGVERSDGQMVPVSRDTVIASGERCAAAGRVADVENLIAKYQ